MLVVLGELKNAWHSQLLGNWKFALMYVCDNFHMQMAKLLTSITELDFLLFFCLKNLCDTLVLLDLNIIYRGLERSAVDLRNWVLMVIPSCRVSV